MRRTAKYTAALIYARSLGFKPSQTISHEALYDTLEGAGHSWDGQQWTNTPPRSNSVFAAGADDIPSGVVNVRVMSHPDEIDEAVDIVIAQLSEWEVITRSSPYPNRRGIGVRVYLTFKRRD